MIRFGLVSKGIDSNQVPMKILEMKTIGSISNYGTNLTKPSNSSSFQSDSLSHVKTSIFVDSRLCLSWWIVVLYSYVKNMRTQWKICLMAKAIKWIIRWICLFTLSMFFLCILPHMEHLSLNQNVPIEPPLVSLGLSLSSNQDQSSISHSPFQFILCFENVEHI